MRQLSELEIRASFRACSSGERKRLVLPDLASVDWQNRDFLAWLDRSNPEVAYLVSAPDQAEASGFVLHAAKSVRRGSGQSMCNLCCTIHSFGGVVLYSTSRRGEAGRRGDSVGDYICADLGCSEYVRGRRKTGQVQLPGSLSEMDRIALLQKSLAQFAHKVMI